MDSHRTPMFAPEIERAAVVTYPGMAHWATSGPEGAKCVGCQYFRLSGGSKAVFGRCLKYTEITKLKGKKIPKWALACKYFKSVVMEARS